MRAAHAVRAEALYLSMNIQEIMEALTQRHSAMHNEVRAGVSPTLTLDPDPSPKGSGNFPRSSHL